MRRPFVFVLAAVIVLLAGATAVLFQRYRKTSAELGDAESAAKSAQARYAEAFDAIAEIQDSLNAIAIGDTTVRILSQGLQAEQTLTEPHRREALERITSLDASLRRSKERIRRLEVGLNKSGVRIAGLERMIAGLKQTVAEKEELVGRLTGRVDSLQTTVAGLETVAQQDRETIRSQQQTLEERRRELGTIYYVIGRKRDLISSGVVVARGGLLGLGRTLQPSRAFNENLFTPLDTDHETVIHTPSSRVKVLSAQPASSYELKLVGNRMEIHILDPREFRKVRHLVIMT
ncbi:MAG: hypothetical protein HZC42_09175 [Candidatus Eisenbacteria bacterium]|nr:hypothetical protein [Candidatus Eisenbacteria bacterium]